MILSLLLPNIICTIVVANNNTKQTGITWKGGVWRRTLSVSALHHSAKPKPRRQARGRDQQAFGAAREGERLSIMDLEIPNVEGVGFKMS